MSQASATTAPSNNEISHGERVAGQKRLAAAFLTSALDDETFYQHALTLADADQDQYARVRDRITRLYVQRGPDKRKVLGLLLGRVAESVQRSRSQGLSTATTRGLALARLAGTSGIVVGDGRQPGDPQRFFKQGEQQHIPELLAHGATLIARRGAGRCFGDTCNSAAAQGNYCRRCDKRLTEYEKRHDRDDVERVWRLAVPIIAARLGKYPGEL